MKIKERNGWLVILILLITQFSFSQNLNSEVEASIITNDNKNEILEISGIAKKFNRSYI